MNNLFVTTQKNRVQVAAAVLLLLFTLVIPQLALADRASDSLDGPADVSTNILPHEAYVTLVEKYKTGELVYNAPGRRYDLSSNILPNEVYAALVEKFKTGELVFHAPGRRSDSSFALLANPELRIFRSFGALTQGVAADANTARWVALGAAFIAESEASILAENPELKAFRGYAAENVCDLSGQIC